MDEEALKGRVTELSKGLDHIENHFLANRNFVAGNEISIADVVAATEVNQNLLTGFPVTKGRPHLEAWMQRCIEKLNPYFDEAHHPVEEFVAPYRWNYSLN